MAFLCFEKVVSVVFWEGRVVLAPYIVTVTVLILQWKVASSMLYHVLCRGFSVGDFECAALSV